MRSLSPLLPLLVFALAAPLPAQQGQIPPPPPPSSPTPRGEPGVTVIHAGTLLDRPGRAPRRNASILIRDGRIVSVEDGFMAAPEGARVIDLRDRFVLPGLIDSHVHLDSDRAGVEGLVAGFTDSVALRAHETAMNARRTLDAGFTTVRNLGSADGLTNRRAMQLIDPRLRLDTPSDPRNMTNALELDANFWVEYGDQLTQRFNAWLAR